MRDYYVIDLETSKPEVCLYPHEIVECDLEYFGVKNALQLSDFNWKVFKTKEEANTWLSRYQKQLQALDNKKICVSKEIPCLLYKRRFIVQTLLGEKAYTCRDKAGPNKIMRNVRPGDLFNLYDQKYFLTVRLTKKEEIQKGVWRYDFTLPFLRTRGTRKLLV